MGRKQRRKGKGIQEEEEEITTTTVSSRYRFFLWICGFFSLASLFIGLDVMTVWPGAEAFVLDLAISNERAAYLPAFINSMFLEAGANLFEKADLFFLFPRILSAIFMLATAVLFYRWGSKLFGKRTVQLQLLLLAASLWIPFHGKFATADSLLLFSHVGMWLSMIYLVRAGRTKHQLYLGIFSLSGAIVAPISTLILSVFLLLVFGYRYSWKKAVQLGWFAALIPVIALLVHGVHQPLVYFISGYSTLKFALLGTLPFIGFAFGGIRDLVFKFRKKEELAIIFSAALLGGLFSESPLFAFALCLIAGKQLQLYFSPNYPWNNWVRGPMILHLIFALIGSFLLLLGGFITFRGDGYRAFLGMVAAYWIFSLIGIIGLYGMRRDYTIGGIVLAGILGTLMFWVQVYPYFEVERNWPTELLREAGKNDLDYQSSKVFVPAVDELSTALPYFRRAGITTTTDSTTADLLLQSYPILDTLDHGFEVEVIGRNIGQVYRYGFIKN